jgi:hypothetical protein
MLRQIKRYDSQSLGNKTRSSIRSLIPTVATEHDPEPVPFSQPTPPMIHLNVSLPSPLRAFKWRRHLLSPTETRPVIEISSFQQHRCLPPLHMRTETGPVSQTLCFLEYWTTSKPPVIPSVIHHRQNPLKSA